MYFAASLPINLISEPALHLHHVSFVEFVALLAKQAEANTL